MWGTQINTNTSTFYTVHTIPPVRVPHSTNRMRLQRHHMSSLFLLAILARPAAFSCKRCNFNQRQMHLFAINFCTRNPA